jgi:hypothetical protein
VQPPDWCSEPPPAVNPPKLRKPDQMCYEDRETRRSRFCNRCQEEADEEEKTIQDALKKEVKQKKSKIHTKISLKERMKRKALEKVKLESVKKKK